MVERLLKDCERFIKQLLNDFWRIVIRLLKGCWRFLNDCWMIFWKLLH